MVVSTAHSMTAALGPIGRYEKLSGEGPLAQSFWPVPSGLLTLRTVPKPRFVYWRQPALYMRMERTPSM